MEVLGVPESPCGELLHGLFHWVEGIGRARQNRVPHDLVDSRVELGLALLVDRPPALRARLEEAHDIFEYVEKEFPDCLERMGAKRDRGRRLRSREGVWVDPPLPPRRGSAYGSPWKSG